MSGRVDRIVAWLRAGAPGVDTALTGEQRAKDGEIVHVDRFVLPEWVANAIERGEPEAWERRQ